MRVQLHGTYGLLKSPSYLWLDTDTVGVLVSADGLYVDCLPMDARGHVAMVKCYLGGLNLRVD